MPSASARSSCFSRYDHTIQYRAEVQRCPLLRRGPILLPLQHMHTCTAPRSRDALCLGAFQPCLRCGKFKIIAPRSRDTFCFGAVQPCFCWGTCTRALPRSRDAFSFGAVQPCFCWGTCTRVLRRGPEMPSASVQSSRAFAAEHAEAYRAEVQSCHLLRRGSDAFPLQSNMKL